MIDYDFSFIRNYNKRTLQFKFIKLLRRVTYNKINFTNYNPHLDERWVSVNIF